MILQCPEHQVVPSWNHDIVLQTRNYHFATFLLFFSSSSSFCITCIGYSDSTASVLCRISFWSFSNILQHSPIFHSLPTVLPSNSPFQNSPTLHLPLHSASATTKQTSLTSITEVICPWNYHGAYMDIVRTLTEYHGHVSESVQSRNHLESLVP